MVTLDDSSGDDRYRLYETMRDYGEQRLADAGQLTQFRDQHATYYLAFVENAAPHLMGSDDATWTDRIESEYANVRAALAWTHDRADADRYARLVVSLRRYWRNQGLLREGLDWLGTVAVTGSGVPARQRAEALAYAGQCAFNLDRYDEGFALVEESRALSAASGEPYSYVSALALGLAAMVQGRPDDVRAHSEEAIALARAEGDDYALAEVFVQVSSFLGLTVDDPAALPFFTAALERARALGNTYLLSGTLQGVGIAHVRFDPARAIALLDESRAVFGDSRNNSMAQGVFWAAIARLAIRDVTGSAQDLIFAVAYYRETGQPYQLSMMLAFAASLLSRTDPDLSVRLLARVDRQREDGEFTGATRDIEVQQRARAALEERLGHDRFASAWAEGRAMNVDDAVTDTLDALDRLADSASGSPQRATVTKESNATSP
jgi:non-specific serine/threonine protein kinase